MKKDVIYIDLEDDITAIIGKVKDSAEKIVALVPPKRTGVLQSAVNLKLLQKGALEEGKRVVLITNDKSLVSLAAGVKMPVAKNLQSKPEVPETPAQEPEENEVINGAELPVGDFAKKDETPRGTEDGTLADDISKKVDLGDTGPAKPAAANAKGKKAGKGLGSKIKIPDFNKFRKKFFIIGAIAIVLIGFLIWALFIAPSATITINAKTSAVNIDPSLTLKSDAEQSKPDELLLKPEIQQITKTSEVEFDATGTKEIGEKAKGSVTLSNSDDSDPVSVPAGTTFTATGGQKFISTSGVTVPGAKVSGGQIQAGKATASVAASDIGPDYNISAQSYSVSGYGNLGASGTAMSGGSREEVRIVSQADVDKAKGQLSQQDADAAKEELKKKLSKDYIVVLESFSTEPGTPVSNPGVGEQAQRGKVTLETTYTLQGLLREDVKKVLDNVLKDALNDKPNQSVFSDGSNSISFQSFQKTNDNTYTTRLVTTGYIGTTIDTNELAEKVKGKRYGEIEQIVNQIPGVEDVDIKFSPFWVTSAPGNTDKIHITFSVMNDTNEN